MDEEFSRQTRGRFSSNPDGLQGNTARCGGKTAVRAAFKGCEDFFLTFFK